MSGRASKNDREIDRRHLEEKFLGVMARLVVSAALSKIRSGLGLTQVEMARRLGIKSRSYYSQIECLSEGFPKSAMDKLAEILSQAKRENKLWNAGELKALRQRLGLTGADMARRLGISR